MFFGGFRKKINVNRTEKCARVEAAIKVSHRYCTLIILNGLLDLLYLATRFDHSVVLLSGFRCHRLGQFGRWSVCVCVCVCERISPSG